METKTDLIRQYLIRALRAGAADECPNHHSASNGQCSVSWCPFNKWNS